MLNKTFMILTNNICLSICYAEEILDRDYGMDRPRNKVNFFDVSKTYLGK